MRRAAARLVTVLVLAVGPLSACSLPGSGPSLTPAPLDRLVEASAPAPEPSLAWFYDQALDWRECRATMRCAELTVPLDYDRPDGTTLTLSVLSVPATDDDQRIGSLVVNPGGPGASGVEYAAAAETRFGAEVRAAYDVVGFDPRGVGQSTPVSCLADDRLDAMIAADPDPETKGEAREGLRMVRELGRGCLERSGALARHLSTEEAARDIDVLRSALGEEHLAWFGASYGTLLGATYADLFPERVGRMVLDGAVDPTLGPVASGLDQARGFEEALRAYVTDCLDRGDCYLGDDVDTALGRIRDFLDRTDASPVPAAGPRELTEGLAVLGIWLPLYNRASWPALDRGLSAALQGNGTLLLGFADQYVGRGPQGFVDNSTEAIYAISCLDEDVDISLEQVTRLEPRFEEASPTFGRIFAFGAAACSSWPVKTGRKPGPLTADGAAPIVVVGTSRDPATPLAWAESLASQLSSGVLVTRDGDGHTGYRAGNECLDDVVESYLVSAEVPDAGTAC